MPELPDVELYVHALKTRVVGQPLERLRLGNPFIVRTIEPTPDALVGKIVRTIRRMGKRIVIGLDDDLWIVIHLMIAGRLRWRERGAAIPGKVGLAAFDFPTGTVIFTEAGSDDRNITVHGQSWLSLSAALRLGIEI